MKIPKGVKYVFAVLAVLLVAVIIWGYLTGGVLFLASALILIAMPLYMIYDTRAKKSEFQRMQEAKLAKAQNFERAGRFEEAAPIYDELKMWEKEAEMRRKAKPIYIEGRTVNISLDLNSILQHVREEGISVPYRCPNCGERTTIDKNSNPSNLRVCRYCNKEFEIVPLKEFLSSLLG